MLKAPGFRLIIKPDEVEEDSVTKSARAMGIQFIEKDEDKLRERAGVDKGIVIDVGQTAFVAYGGDPWCAVGDHIAYARHAGKWVKDPDTEEALLIINDEDVVCILIKTLEKDA